MSKGFWKGRNTGLAIDGPILAASLTLNLLSLLTPLAILLIFDRVIPFQSFDTLTLLTLLLCVAAGMELVLRWTRSTVLNVAAERAAVHNHMRFLNLVTSANVREFAKSPPTLHFEHYGAVGRLRDHFSGQNQALAIDIPFTAVFFLMIGFIGGWLVVVPLVCLLAVVAFAAVMKSAQGTIFDKRKTYDERRYAFLSEVLSKIATVKSNTMERQMTRRFELLQDQTVVTSHKLILLSGFAQSFGSIVSQFSIAGIGLFGAYLVIAGAIGMAELAACMMLNGRIIQPLTRLITLWVQAEMLSVSRRKLSEMEVLKPRYENRDPIQPMRGEIVLRKAVLANTVHTVPVSKVISSGKTILVDSDFDWAMPALIDALSGQVSLKSGSILIDGLMPEDRMTERGALGLVVLERSPALFTGTVLDNISAFGDAQQVERAIHFARVLGLERRVFRLPSGYLTELNTNSVFEKDQVNQQLIALVRVLAMQPKIILMHEPTSVLETAEREALTKCLSDLSPRPTIIMASPDPRMKRLADEVLPIVSSNKDTMAEWQADADADVQAQLILTKGVA
ncbi:MAG: ABC transporter transmembrane domain-containing protein [Roseobacter sp.]